MDVPQTPFITRPELAKRWHMSVRTLETWLREGRGPQGRRFGQRILYLLADVEEYERARYEADEPRDAPRGAAKRSVAAKAVSA